MRNVLLSALTLCSLTVFAAPANAAFININDNDLGLITLTAGDFEGGFSVDGVLLTSGLGNSGSITVADSGHTISGRWIDLGVTPPAGGRVDLIFALLSGPTLVTSGVEFGYSTDGYFATLGGSFGGFTGNPYFVTAGPTVAQDGHIEFGGAPFLSVSFDSEAPVVPEPATLLMVGPALALLARRRSRRG